MNQKNVSGKLAGTSETTLVPGLQKTMFVIAAPNTPPHAIGAFEKGDLLFEAQAAGIDCDEVLRNQAVLQFGLIEQRPLPNACIRSDHKGFFMRATRY